MERFDKGKPILKLFFFVLVLRMRNVKLKVIISFLSLNSKNKIVNDRKYDDLIILVSADNREPESDTDFRKLSVFRCPWWSPVQSEEHFKLDCYMEYSR